MSDEVRAAHSGALDCDTLRSLTAGRFGVIDAACPVCAPNCRTPANARRQVLRIWDDGEFITYKCARCETHGWAREGRSAGSKPIARAARIEIPKEDKSELARFLWGKSLPAAGSLVETYRRSRHCWLPSDDIRFLPGRGDHPPAMISRFDASGMTTGVHLTKLAHDGSGKAGTDKDKIMIGPSLGQPIIVHDNPDRGEVFITEGIEDAASLAIATGWNAWAAGSAGRIASVLPLARRYEKVFIPMDRDRAGRQALGRCLAIRPDVTPLRLWRALPFDQAADANKAMMAYGPSVLRAVVNWSDALASHGHGHIGYEEMMRVAQDASAVFSGIAAETMQ